MKKQSQSTQVQGMAVRILAVLLLFSFVLGGCAPQATALPTSTASPVPPTATDTPQPTSTVTPSATPTETPTLTPTATPDKKATTSARRTATAEAQLALVQPDLEAYGIDTSKGELVWYDEEEITLNVTDYLGADFYPVEEHQDLANFVAQSKINWETSGALSSCGFVFRYNEELDNSQYAVEMIRLQFDPRWAISYYQYGQFQYPLTGVDMHSKDINDTNNSTNVLTIVAQGETFTTYINGKKQQVMEHSRIPRGMFALVASQESGYTTCRFSESWIFELE